MEAMVLLLFPGSETFKQLLHLFMDVNVFEIVRGLLVFAQEERHRNLAGLSTDRWTVHQQRFTITFWPPVPSLERTVR